jgi:hypothetical protein
MGGWETWQPNPVPFQSSLLHKPSIFNPLPHTFNYPASNIRHPVSGFPASTPPSLQAFFLSPFTFILLNSINQSTSTMSYQL